MKLIFSLILNKNLARYRVLVWDILEKPKSFSEIIQRLLSEFDVTEALMYS